MLKIIVPISLSLLLSCSSGEISRKPAAAPKMWSQPFSDWKKSLDLQIKDAKVNTAKLLCMAENKLNFLPEAKAFSPDNAYFLALMSALAYETQETGAAIAKIFGFKSVDFLSAKQKGNGAKTLGLFLLDLVKAETAPMVTPIPSGSGTKAQEDAVVNTDAFLLENDQFAVLTFRGTGVAYDLNEYPDLLTDSDVRQTDTELFGKIHTGFYQNVRMIYPQIVERLRTLPPGKPLWITGHSLGGDIALLLTAALFRERFIGTGANGSVDESDQKKSQDATQYLTWINGLYTYGMPKPGDQLSVDAIEKLFQTIRVSGNSVGDSALSPGFFTGGYARIVNTFDPIPTLPRDFPKGRIFYAQNKEALKYIDKESNLLSWPESAKAAPTTIEELLSNQREAIRKDLVQSFTKLERSELKKRLSLTMTNLKNKELLKNHDIYSYLTQLAKALRHEDLSRCGVE